MKPRKAEKEWVWNGFVGLPSFLSISVLLLNDHLLKGAQELPGWLTGKLSDFAGLFFFPLLLTAISLIICRLLKRPLRGQRWLRLSCLFTASLFVGIQLSPEVHSTYLELVSFMAAPFGRAARSTQDPTDLLALPMVALAYYHGQRHTERALKT